MFLTADWTKPQVGGLLSEIIEKEERQLRAPKPRIEVQHVWDPKALAERPTLWKDVQARMVDTFTDGKHMPCYHMCVLAEAVETRVLSRLTEASTPISYVDESKCLACKGAVAGDG